MIAFRLEASVMRILAANPGLDPNNLQVGQVICIPSCPPNHVSRIIERGDTLYQIAQDYGVSVASILEANPGVTRTRCGWDNDFASRNSAELPT